MGYMEEVLGITEMSGGHSAPVDLLTKDKIYPPTKTYGYEEFLDFDEADSLLLAEITEEDRPPAPPGYHYMPDGKLMRDDAHEKEQALTSADGPCWPGYVQIGMKEKDGKQVPNCVPADEAALYATAGSKPAPKKDQIKGSDKNKKGSAATGKKVNFTEKIISALENKVETHNKSVKGAAGKKATLTSLKAVYRRGAGAFSTSHRPDQNRNSWAMARVNAYLHLLKTGSPKNSKYTTDNDLLPKSHPKSTR